MGLPKKAPFQLPFSQQPRPDALVGPGAVVPPRPMFGRPRRFGTNVFYPGHPDAAVIPIVIPKQPMIFGRFMGKLGGKTSLGPDFPVRLVISGVTKDGTGAILGSCSVLLFRTSDNLLMGKTTSDPTTGAYSFSGVGAVAHFVVAYGSSAPDVSGTTVNTLIGS